MTISVFDLFKMGIGPSSSHTVGPMRAAVHVRAGLPADGLLHPVAALRASCSGRSARPGTATAASRPVVLGLEGEQPDQVDPVGAQPRVDAVRRTGS